MISFPDSLDGLEIAPGAMVRAGGTDLQERLRSRPTDADIVDLTGVRGFADLDLREDGARLGAGATVAAVARELRSAYPALASTARALATPQIRVRATIGGNLLQRTRCWYYRHPDLDCWKTGGEGCPARTGRHLYGVVFDRSACVHPHPSSVGMALLTYDAGLELADGTTMSVADLFGDGADPTRDHLLPDGAVLAAVTLPAPWAGEAAAYVRSISRFEAEWPLVECVVRARLEDGAVAACGIGLGGVATVPLRMRAAEQQLTGRSLDDDTIAAAAAACADGATPLPETGYKVDLVVATVRETLERLRAGHADEAAGQRRAARSGDL